MPWGIRGLNLRSTLARSYATWTASGGPHGSAVVADGVGADGWGIRPCCGGRASFTALSTDTCAILWITSVEDLKLLPQGGMLEGVEEGYE